MYIPFVSDRVILATASFAFNSFKQFHAAADFGFLAFRLLRDFAFDGQRADVADFGERAEEIFHAHVAFAQGDFAAPLAAGIFRPAGVFAMHAADVLADLSSSAAIGSPQP